MFVLEHDPNLKGNIAELKIAAEATRLGIPVLSPMTEHGRYDLVSSWARTLIRIQCKWASVRGAVIQVNTAGNRLTPRGYVGTTYSAAEIDAIAVYCGDLDRCYLLPVDLVARPTQRPSASRGCEKWPAGLSTLGGGVRAPWGCSSAGQSAGVARRRPWVRVPPAPLSSRLGGARRRGRS